MYIFSICFPQMNLQISLIFPLNLLHNLSIILNYKKLCMIQILFTKINISSLSNYKQHLFKLIKELAKEKVFLFLFDIIPNICLVQKPTIGNMYSCFFYHFEKYFMFFASTWYFQNINKLLLTNFFIGSLVFTITISTISKLLSTLDNGWKWW